MNGIRRAVTRRIVACSSDSVGVIGRGNATTNCRLRIADCRLRISQISQAHAIGCGSDAIHGTLRHSAVHCRFAAGSMSRSWRPPATACRPSTSRTAASSASTRRSDPRALRRARSGTGRPEARNPELLRVRPSHGHDQTIVNGISRIGYMTGGRAALWRTRTWPTSSRRRPSRFIERHRVQAVLPVLRHARPPRAASARTRDSSARRAWGRGATRSPDRLGVGEMLAALDRLKLADDTLVIFTSDNGPVVDDGYQDRRGGEAGSASAGGRSEGRQDTARSKAARGCRLSCGGPRRVRPGVSAALLSQVDLRRVVRWHGLGSRSPPEASDSEDVMRALLGTSRRRVERRWSSRPAALRCDRARGN